MTAYRVARPPGPCREQLAPPRNFWRHMPSKRKFYLTVFQVEVLSEDPLVADDLDEIHSAITTGDCSGAVQRLREETLDGPTTAAKLREQASDPGFFQLTDDGDDSQDADEPIETVDNESVDIWMRIAKDTKKEFTLNKASGKWAWHDRDSPEDLHGEFAHYLDALYDAVCPYLDETE
jgi:hypothetical protein